MCVHAHACVFSNKPGTSGAILTKLVTLVDYNLEKIILCSDVCSIPKRGVGRKQPILISNPLF